MATSRAEIAGWIARGKNQNATHLIVVCDTFDNDDYPVFVEPGEDVRAKYKEYNGPNMQRVMEVYDLSLDTDEQLAKPRAFNF